MQNSQIPLNALDLTTLRLLVAAIEEGNLGRAAERENISISSISRRIGDLEARLNVPLLHRSDRGVTPTAAALAVLPRLRDSLGLLEQFLDDLREHASGLRGLVRIRAHATALSGPLPTLLRSFLDVHSSLDVVVEDASSADAIHAVRVGTADVGFVSGTVEANEVRLLPWAEDEMSAVVPVGHKLAMQVSVTFAEMLDYPFVGMQRESALLALFRRQAELAGRTLWERTRVNGFEAVRKLVGAGLGVSILPRAAAVGHEPIAVLRLEEPWARRPLMICVPDHGRTSAACKLLVDHLLHASATGSVIV